MRLLGTASLRMIAIGSEQRDFARGDLLFAAGDDADAGFVVQRGAFRVEDDNGAEMEEDIALIEIALFGTDRKHPQSGIAQQS